MNKKLISLAALITLFTQSCAMHHPVASYHSGIHHNQVSVYSNYHRRVDFHGSYHGHLGTFLGPLILGGIIGHILTVSSDHDNATHSRHKHH